jgi:hypothetical protein
MYDTIATTTFVYIATKGLIKLFTNDAVSSDFHDFYQACAFFTWFILPCVAEYTPDFELDPYLQPRE